MNANGVKLTFAFRSTEIPFGEIEAVDVREGWGWDAVRIRHASGGTAVSGLSRDDARTFASALEAAWADWWRGPLSAHADALRSVHERVVEVGNPPDYVTQRAWRSLRRDAEMVASRFPSRWPEVLSTAPEFQLLEAVRDFLRRTDTARADVNQTYVSAELDRCREFFDRVEKRPLSDEQRRAVVVDEERNLVVAAAGSGKTSVIVAKAGWLLKRGQRRPAELLVLAFARDARNELEERVRDRLGGEESHGVDVRTFHSLGMLIIGRAEGKRPSLAKSAEDHKALESLLKEIVRDLRAEGAVSKRLLEWFQSQFAPYRSEHEFKSRGAYYDYIRRYELRSLQGDRVKSFEECEIANFLYCNGVDYEYEAEYEHATANKDKRQYKPDFYLPGPGIYIEHFGLNAAGNTAPYVDQEEYRSGMDWKRTLHKKHRTVLIETFSYEHSNGTLLSDLRRKLTAYGVTFSPIPPEEVFSKLEQLGSIDPFIRLVANFLHQFKGNQLSLSDLKDRAATEHDRVRATAFLEVFEPIFERYQGTLSKHGQVDFHDMIGKATEHVEAGRYLSPFRYILVDEFQDISPGRARLLKALLGQAPDTRLFAVGDDWQAIYRFGGSDIAVMRQFGERFGPSEQIQLETTFRCSDRIASVATEFVLRNRAQIRKNVHAVRRAGEPTVHVGLPGAQDLALLPEALERIAADAAKHGGQSDVLLLGRYRHLKPPNMSALDRRHPRLRLRYMTVHASKGTEADYVVVLGLCSGKYGFPAEIADDPLLDLVLSAPERHPNAEERRLLYVAMTRARRHVHLLADGGPPSAFVRELIDGNHDVTIYGRLPENDVACPTCVEGRLERRENSQNGRVFYGCSNWPYCEYRQPPCPSCGTGLLARADGKYRCRDCRQLIEACPECGAWLVPRNGKYGRFLGCSNYPVCDFTRDFAPRRRRPATAARPWR